MRDREVSTSISRESHHPESARATVACDRPGQPKQRTTGRSRESRGRPGRVADPGMGPGNLEWLRVHHGDVGRVTASRPPVESAEVAREGTVQDRVDWLAVNVPLGASVPLSVPPPVAETESVLPSSLRRVLSAGTNGQGAGNAQAVLAGVPDGPVVDQVARHGLGAASAAGQRGEPVLPMVSASPAGSSVMAELLPQPELVSSRAPTIGHASCCSQVGVEAARCR